MIWLVDASTYARQLSASLAASKKEFFQLEKIARFRKYGSHPPRGVRSCSMGVLQIAHILRHSGHTVKYLTLEDAEKMIEPGDSRAPDVIGFSAVTPTVNRCAALAAKFRQVYPRVKVALGGAHATAAPKLTSERFPVFNRVVTARGIAAASYLARVEQGIRPQTWYELLPFSTQEYGINLMTYEGCPFNCAYCHDRFIDHLETTLDGGLATIHKMLLPRTPVHFCDSVLGGNRIRATAVCDCLSRISHGMLLSCDMRAEYIDEVFVRKLECAGFVELRIGLESADDDVLTASNRSCLSSRVREALQCVRENSNLYVSIYVITGLPGSTVQSGEKNCLTVKDLFEKGLADQIKHHLYVPYPLDDCPAGHSMVSLITDDWSQFDRNSFPVYRLKDLDPDQIWEAYLQMESLINTTWRHVLHKPASETESLELYSDYNARVWGLLEARPSQPGT